MNLGLNETGPKVESTQEKAEDVIKKLYHELDLVVLGKYPKHENLASWLRNRYAGIECYAYLAIENGSLEKPAEAQVILARYLSLVESVFTEIQRMGNTEYTESQLIALQNGAEILKTVFKLPKN